MPISKIKQSSLDASALTGANITDGTIAAADLATDAVTTAKIASGSVTNAKIASDAITTAKIADTVNLGRRNLLINGAMLVDQRNGGASVTVSNGVDTFCPDRFRFTENHSGTFTIEQVSDAPVGFEKSSKITVTGTDTSLGATEFARILQGIEGKNISHLNWGSANAKTCTLSFYVKSSVTGQYYVSINNGATNRNMLKGYTIDAANTWEKKTIQIIGDTTGTWLTTNGGGIFIMWTLGTGSTFQSSTTDSYQAGFFMGKSDQINLAATNSATWQLTGAQLEVGTATPFEHRSFDEELFLCQRYFQLISGGCFPAASSGTLEGSVTRREMRAAPTIGATAVLKVEDPSVTTYTQASAVVTTVQADAFAEKMQLKNFSGLSTQRPYFLRNPASSSGQVTLEAEL